MKVKAKLWVVTSELVRMSAADENGMVRCVTCGGVRHYKEVHAGHFLTRAHGNAVYFDLRNIHVQCPVCNMNGGKPEEYHEYMLQKEGPEVIEDLVRLSHGTLKMYEYEFQSMLNDRKQLLKQEHRRVS